MHRDYFHWNHFRFFGRLCRWASFDKDGMITPYGIYMVLVNRKNDTWGKEIYEWMPK